MKSLLIFLTLLGKLNPCICHLYPKESESRERRDLCGMWNFRTSGNDQASGFVGKWYLKPLADTGPVLRMPVPSSYNDVTQDKSLRDYIGWVWYDSDFFVPARWDPNEQQVLLRFGSVHYMALVWVNGAPATNHTGGHLPFEGDVTNILKYGSVNRVTVAVNNTMSHHTIPPGEVVYQNGPLYPPGYHTQTVFFDFFNYAGIHRPVWLYTRPLISHIEDIVILATFHGDIGMVRYTVTLKTHSSNLKVEVKVLDKNGTISGESSGRNGTVKIRNPNLWWPIHMEKNPGYMYTLRVALVVDAKESDVYRQKFGIRTINVTPTHFVINGKPFYFTGYAMHEDSDIRGKGVDLPLITKNFNLIDWSGGNSIRTSHYPYAEEMMDECDERGIVVIDECPAVGLRHDYLFKSKQILELHISMLKELVSRDKNRPSVVMWSVANEPYSGSPLAEPYFKQVVDALRSFDPTKRPVTAVVDEHAATDRIEQFMDVNCINRYNGWYLDTGHTEVIQAHVVDDIENFHRKYNKPVIFTEYGAGTVTGLHRDPSFVYTEDYQVDLLENTHKGFDKMRSSCLVGEMIWNFADFMTDQEVGRVVGNKKGVFTRQRQPKSAAHSLRKRYKMINNIIV